VAVKTLYGTSGADFVVVAKGGADEDPAWFENLRADPGRVRAPWTRMAGIFPRYDEYAQKADRVLPDRPAQPQD
jgi:hypothetical protein